MNTSGRKEEIIWGKLNPVLAYKTFQDLYAKGQLSLEDCRGCKLTLENTRLNILEGIDLEHNNDIEWIENTMSLVEVATIEIENNIEIIHENLEFLPEKINPTIVEFCSRCTMESNLCQFKLCHECCIKKSCRSHSKDYWKDDLSDHILNNIEPTSQQIKEEFPDSKSINSFKNLNISDQEALNNFFQERKKKKNKNKGKRGEKEIWADALFGIEEKEKILVCPDCDNNDLYSQGQFDNYCYVCKKNVK